MASMTPRLARTRVGLLAGSALAAGSLVIAACSSSGSGGGTPAGAAGTGGGGGGTHAAKAAAVVVETHSGPLGTYLTDGSGKTLYEFASDKMNQSSCTGACLSIWPALTGSAKAGSGAQSSKLGSISSSKQVTYAGHPLYYYSGDSSAGSTNGQGLNQFGGVWWVMSASGHPITGSGGGSGSGGSSSSSGGGGGGSWG